MYQELVLAGFYFLTMIYSIIIHEVSHGVMALFLGDRTAQYAGRINLNPAKHIDPFGSIILPILMYLAAGFAFGWAKPVPYNPYNLRDQKWGPLLVALAGPGSNLFVALVAALLGGLLPLSLAAKNDILSRFLNVVGGGGDFFDRFGLLAAALSGSLATVFFGLLLLIIFWNVVLACFNLLPVPPLDGSKLLYALVPFREETKMMLEQYGFILLVIMIVFLSAPISFFIRTVLSWFLAIAL